MIGSGYCLDVCGFNKFTKKSLHEMSQDKIVRVIMSIIYLNTIKINFSCFFIIEHTSFDAAEEGNSNEIKAAIISGANISTRDPVRERAN